MINLTLMPNLHSVVFTHEQVRKPKDIKNLNHSSIWIRIVDF